MIKRVLSFVLCFCLLFAVVACQDGSYQVDVGGDTAAQDTTSDTGGNGGSGGSSNGGSQGGGLSIACAALVPEIKLCAPVYPYLSDYKRVWEMDLAKHAYEGIQYYFRNSDPLHEREDEIFTKLGYVDIQFLAPRIKAKVLMSTGLMDTICPPSTQFAMYNKITSEKSVLIYPDYGHEYIKGNSDMIFKFLSQL